MNISSTTKHFSQAVGFDVFHLFLQVSTLPKTYSPKIPHPHNIKGLEINLQYLRANLPSNKHIKKHAFLFQMSLIHC